MLRKVNLRTTLIAGATAAILFCIPVYAYIRAALYQQSWLLYMGSILFMITMWVHIISDSKKRSHNESTVALVFASHMATLAGIVFCCLLCFLLLSLLVPGYLRPGNAGTQLKQSPVNIIHDKTNGMSFNIFMAATIINFSVGSFTGIILPFYVKKNQIRDSKKPAPLHQQGKK